MTCRRHRRSGPEGSAGRPGSMAVPDRPQSWGSAPWSGWSHSSVAAQSQGSLRSRTHPDLGPPRPRPTRRRRRTIRLRPEAPRQRRRGRGRGCLSCLEEGPRAAGRGSMPPVDCTCARSPDIRAAMAWRAHGIHWRSRVDRTTGQRVSERVALLRDYFLSSVRLHVTVVSTEPQVSWN